MHAVQARCSTETSLLLQRGTHKEAYKYRVVDVSILILGKIRPSEWPSGTCGIFIKHRRDYRLTVYRIANWDLTITGHIFRRSPPAKRLLASDNVKLITPGTGPSRVVD